MNEQKQHLSFDEFDELRSPRPEETDFDAVVERAISRRGFLGVVSVGTAGFLAGAGGFLPGTARAADRFGFDQVPATTADTITLPEGFSWHPVVSWGDPMFSDSPDFDWATRGNAAAQAKAYGDNTDGMSLFSINGHSVLVANNEYTNLEIINGHLESKRPETDDDVQKGLLAHGVSIVELARTDGKWGVVIDSPYNRRITPETPMTISGPAAGHELMKTEADPTGTRVFGTWNNCANGRTPWGTYLACEENFNGYYSSSDPDFQTTPAMDRYGISHDDWGYGWARVDERFDISKHPNESNRNGYVVEIDPSDASSTPVKRTALGRFKHENCEIVINGDGRIVAYMGDDERGEFLYRFVSDGTYSVGGDNASLLDAGTLYAAGFSDDGTGRWLALTEETTGMSAAEVCIHTRMAASHVGATTMDRPEWVTANPIKPEVYAALTNNKNRGVKPNAGGDDTSPNGPNPRPENNYGQIVRWMPDGGDHAADGFTWDLFVLAGNPTVHSDAYAGSDNVTPDNMFNSPDGLTFDSTGLLWIQTDGGYKNEGDFAGQGNNQMLAGDTETGEIRRFMVGPAACEVTGCTWSADKRTMFVGIQHPGEDDYGSTFPGGEGTVPRSTIVAISRDDGGLIG